MLDGMRRAVERGTGLTRHLLAFSRRGRSIPSRSIRDPPDRHARDVRWRAWRAHPVEMKFDADLWPVEIDTGELELAILNLCLNARDAMPDGGAITIAAENVRWTATAGRTRTSSSCR